MTTQRELTRTERIVLGAAAEIIGEGETPNLRRLYHRTRDAPSKVTNQEMKAAARSLRARGLMPDPRTEEAEN